MALLLAPLATSPVSADSKLKIVATTSIIADLVKNVVGENAEIVTLVPADGDVHTFEPSPADSVALADADVIFEIGLGFEFWLDRLYEASGSKARRVRLANSVQPLASNTMLRLLVSDFETAPSKLIDLDNGKIIARYEVSAPTYPYTSPTGRFGVKIQTNANLITAVDSGILLEDHGDHMHPHKREARLTDFRVEGRTPIHYVAHAGQIAIFNDGSGEVMLLTERNFESAEAEILTFKTARPHHGVAVPLGDRIVLSVPDTQNMDYELPLGIEVRDMRDNVVASFADQCPGLHGEASSGAFTVFGCADRVLVLERKGDAFSVKSLRYAPETPSGTRVGLIIGHEKQNFFIGNFGQTGLVRIDPIAGTLTPITLPMRYSAFRLDAETGEKIIAVTTDGSVHRIDAMTGRIEASIEAVTPFVFRKRVPRPGLATVRNLAYVTDPAAGEVVEIDLEAMNVTRRFVVEGKPVRLAVLGLLEKEHEHDHDHDHGHDHKHKHEHGMFDPHIWTDVTNAQAMVRAIRDAMIELDAANASVYRSNAKAYLDELAALDRFVREQVAQIPEANRILVTPHNSFAYFAERYGFRTMSPLGVTTAEADPAAGALAELIEEIKALGVKAVFPDNTSSPRLMELIAREAGVALGKTLIADSLSAKGETATYIGKVRHNVSAIVEALK
ncbi:MAG: zinc ABC transporter substrate-binding protein [Chloroflexi bacterium]|jgi:ABC-type Zn uptake system ZnuABC Zn-binding protein ZnuA|nr:zinc ABC transporter substrate-binding protein [Chloroflexota bacterium]